MNAEKLEKIVVRHEMQCLELKESFYAECIETACAFANAQGMRQQWKSLSCLDERERRVLHSVPCSDNGVGGKIGIDLAKLGLDASQSTQKEPESTLKSNMKSSMKSEDRLMLVLKDDQTMSLPKMAEAIGLSVAGVRKVLDKLKASGRIRRVGPDKGGYWEVMDGGAEQGVVNV